MRMIKGFFVVMFLIGLMLLLDLRDLFYNTKAKLK
jgi:hypothetical protein